MSLRARLLIVIAIVLVTYAVTAMFVVGNQQQRFDEARRYVDLVRGSPEADPEHQAGLSSAIGNLMYAQGSYEEAEAEHRRALASWESVKYVRILPGEFSPESGELTPSLKVKRKVVAERHADTIESMYR